MAHVFIGRQLSDVDIYNPYADSSNPISIAAEMMREAAHWRVMDHAGLLRLHCGCDEGRKGCLVAECSMLQSMSVSFGKSTFRFLSPHTK